MHVPEALPKSLSTALLSVNRRLRALKTLKWFFPVLSGGLLITLLLTLLGRLYPLALPVVLLALGLWITLIALLVTLAAIWLRPQSSLTIAHLLDRHLKLDERLSTTLELVARDNSYEATPATIVQAQLADTRQHLQQFEVTTAFPVRFGWGWPALSMLFIVAIAINMFMPNPQVGVLQGRAKAEATIAKQRARFEEIQAELLEDEALLETPQGDELQQTLDELIDSLQEENLTLEEAMAAVSEAEQSLATLEDAAAQQANTLNDLAQLFSQFDSTADLAEALEQRDLAGAAEALTAAGRKALPSPEAGQALADALQEAAQAAAAAGDSELAEALQQAAEALEQATSQDRDTQSGDAQMLQQQTEQQQAAQEALQQAAAALADAAEQREGQEALQQALTNIQEARQQLAEANGQVELGQGQGQAQLEQGQGTDSGESAGQGLADGGAGRGEAGLGAEGLFSVEGAPDRMSTDNGANESLLQEYSSLYAPDHLGGEGGPIIKPDEQGAEGGLPIGDALVDPDRDPEAALVPYNQLYGQYADAASQALDDSYIPLGMKGYVRQYFGALEPGGNE